MANYAALASEISGDPLGRGYAGMTNAEIVADLTTAYRSRNRASISGDEAFQSTDQTEFAGLTDAQRQLWLAFCGRANIDPFASANVAFVQYIFGSGSVTVSNLANIRVESITRATEIGFPNPTVDDIARVH